MAATEPGHTRYEKRGAVAQILFDRPATHNALTREMWQELGDACARIAGDAEIRVVTLRGAGGKAFVSGADIGRFASFTGAADGLAYEAEVDGFVAAVEALPQPTIAIIDGWAVGGGLALSFACDFRIAVSGARFGSPLARTIGNCLSARGYTRLLQHVGITTTKRLLLAAELVTAEELLALGVLNGVVAPQELDEAVAKLVERLLGNAPLTLRASKEAIRRVMLASPPDVADLIEQVYGSEDFAAGVRGFLAKTPPHWRGR